MIRKLIKRFRVLRKRQERRCLTCPWCGDKIKPGSEITCYSLFHPADRDKFTMMGRVKIVSHNPTTFVGCTSLTCPSNRDGVIIGGFFEKNGQLKIKKPESNKIFDFPREKKSQPRK